MALDFNTTEVFTRAQLMATLKRRVKGMLAAYRAEQKEGNENQSEEELTRRLVVGTVGYPNVGKSSVINVICGRKRVGVASLPGKTKHFQTLNIGDDLQLVDCPGLVFPSFANSRAEMMVCGVLPIDKIRECAPPCQLVLDRVPKDVLEGHYKIKLPPRGDPLYTVTTFLGTYAAKKGWLTARNLPNEFQAAKKILKDYTTGKLIFSMLRPDFDPEKHKAVQQCGFYYK